LHSTAKHSTAKIHKPSHFNEFEVDWFRNSLIQTVLFLQDI
jgi:hypothetical protein